jgi:sec-independent protein translocase protein TatB
MFNVGSGELLVILLLALIVLGPEKLPDAARKVGNVVAELRRMSQGFQDEVRRAMEDTASGDGTAQTPQSPEPQTRQPSPPSPPSLPALEPVRDSEPEPPAEPDRPAAVGDSAA